MSLVKNKNLKRIEGSPIVKYSKMKKKNLFSLYDRVYNKYRNEISNYENSFILPKKDPNLILFNNSKDDFMIDNHKLSNNKNSFFEFYKNDDENNLNPNIKDGYVDMSKPRFVEFRTQPVEFENYNIKSLEYNGPLNETFFQQEFLMLNSILSQLFINSTRQKIKTKKKYRIGEVNINTFDFYDNYKEEFLKAKEEMLLKEAANHLLNYMGKRKKLISHMKFREIPVNNFFENFLDKIIRRVEVRKDNNELVSVEFIVNMIKEEIESNNMDPIIIRNNSKIENNCNNEDNMSQYSYLPPIHSKPASVLNEQVEKKVPFLDYENIANVRRLKKNKGNYSDGDSNQNSPKRQKNNFRYIKDKNGNYVIEEDYNEIQNEEDFINSLKNSGLKNKTKKRIDLKMIKKGKEGLKDISEEEINRNNSDCDLENKRNRRKNKFLAKIRSQQSAKDRFEYVNYFTDENNNEMRRSFNLHMRFQKTHINFLKRIDTFFLTTQSSGIDDLRQTLGPLNYNYRKKINELLKKNKEKLEKKTEDGI